MRESLLERVSLHTMRTGRGESAASWGPIPITECEARPTNRPSQELRLYLGVAASLIIDRLKASPHCSLTENFGNSTAKTLPKPQHAPSVVCAFSL